MPSATISPRATPAPDVVRRDRAAPSAWAVSAVWLLPAIADLAGMFIGARASGTSLPFWLTVARVAPIWAVWVPLTITIFWLERRVPVVRSPSRTISWPGVATHAAAALVAAVVHATAIAAALRATHSAHASQLAWGAVVSETVGDWLPVSLLLYAMTLGAAVALERVRRAREQEAHATALEGRLAQAELEVLRAQLEPHFLFNALNTAVSLVRAGEPAAGVDVLTRLADVLRHVLDRVEQETRLVDELQLLDSYLGIAHARFGARLTVTMDVPPALGDAMVPGLALQPLVENALRHGVGRRDGPGRVWVDAWVPERDADVLCLRVRDDGPGLDGLPDESRDGRVAGGLGLRNLRDRLERLYGPDAAGLTLGQRDGGGAEATVWLPLRRGPVGDVRTERA